ncbi:MAG TPA: glycosyltransferase family 4 protein [Thermoleophilaceae bacterium]|nr:glycosyltransferase family 4 protein [Thermoleophilaceae bacterium]
MRVIHAADYEAPYGGAFVPMLRAVAGAVRERGGTVEVALPDGARERPWLRELEEASIPVSFAPARDRRGSARCLAGLAEGGEPTILHTHFASFDLPAISVARDRPATQVFWHVHRSPEQRRGLHVRSAVRFARAARRVNKILCAAPDIAAAVQSRHAPAERVVLLPDAIDLERFPPRNRARTAEARRRLGLRAGARVLLHFGWDWEAKGGELFVAAARHLSERESVVAVTVGGGARARAARAKSGLTDDQMHVIEPLDDVATLYAAADVFVSTSRLEGVPFAVAEALASGLPVVATDIPGHAELAHRAGNVRLALREPDEVAATIRSALSADARLVEDMGARARARVSEQLDLGSWSERLVGLYERALVAPGRLS